MFGVPWLNPKLIGLWVFGLSFLGLLFYANDQRHQVQRLADFQAGVVLAASQATVEPDKNGKIALLKPEQVAAAIATLKSNEVAAKTQIKTQSAATALEKKRADAADQRLTKELASFKATYAIANRQITYLSTRPPVPEADVCRVIKEDTNSAWDGWKKETGP